MNKKTLVVAVIIAVVVAAVGIGSYLLTQISEDITAPGNHQVYFQFEGSRRNYELHIPTNYDRNKLTPLVIVLHEYTQNARNIESLTGFTAKSDKEGFIVVYPEGVGQSWNVHYGYGLAQYNNINDVGFINELINRLQEKLKIDQSRIYVAGFSNGAMMAYLLAAELSDRIAAIAPVAGSIGGRANQGAPLYIITEASQPVSVIVFHGTEDISVPYNGGVEYGGGHGPHSHLSVAEAVAFWVKCDGCSKTPQNETTRVGLIKSVYTGGKNGTEVVLYTIVGGTHEYPTLATDIIWDFFASHPKQ